MLDDLDRKLLKILQADSTLPVQTMAETVGLSAPACYRRIRRLRQSGIIERDVAIVRARALGWPLSMIVLLELEREGPRTTETMMRKLSGVPEIIEAWSVTGDEDIAIRMVARDMENYDMLVHRLFSADELVKNVKTLVIVRQLKEQSPIPVEVEG